MSNITLTIAISLLACICLQVRGETCLKDFKNIKEMGVTVKKCLDQVGVSEAEKDKMMSFEALEKSGYEDKVKLTNQSDHQTKISRG
jgi:hypothetical protein